MKLMLKIKLLLYRFFFTYLGKKILTFLSFGVNVDNLGNGKNPKNKPFLIAITVDTESGYVNKDERRVWQKEKPDAFDDDTFHSLYRVNAVVARRMVRER